MKAINVEVFRFVFIPLFMAMVPSTVALALTARRTKQRPVLMLGAFVYFAFVFLVTGMGNVPMNKALAALEGEAASTYWRTKYLRLWTRLNTIRTMGCLVSATCSLIAVAAF